MAYIFVAGAYGAGKTGFMTGASSRGPATVSHWPIPSRPGADTSQTAPFDAAYFDVSDHISLLFLANQGLYDPVRILKSFDGKIVKGIRFDGYVVVVDSSRSDMDKETGDILRVLQTETRPYIVAFNRHDVPGARTAQDLRDTFSIPEEVRILGYDWNDPRTVKQIVLELVKLFPRTHKTWQMIDKLKETLAEA